MNPAHLEQIKQFLIKELIKDYKEKMFMLVEEWEKCKQSKTSSCHRRNQKHLTCDRKVGHKMLFNDFLVDKSVYPNNIFLQRFWMLKVMFLQIVETLENHLEYFLLRDDVTVKWGLSLREKYVVCCYPLTSTWCTSWSTLHVYEDYWMYCNWVFIHFLLMCN